ncbi:MAG: Gfo/Idh/MocA family oxidoreductase [Acidimicrobiia bacterium]
MSRTLNVGIVGCGVIAAPHVTTLNAAKNEKADSQLKNAMGDVSLHLFDLEMANAKMLNEKYSLQAQIHDSYESLLDAGLDAVHILTPPVSHANLATQAINKGINVLVEKPFTTRFDEAKELYELAEKNNVLLCVDHSTIYMPNVRALLERINSNEFGRPVAFNCFYGHAESKNKIPYKDPTHWAYRTPGGLLINHISHPASLLVELMGVPTQILSQSASYTLLPDDMNDSLSISVMAQTGMGTITVAMAQGNHHRHATIWCEKGTVMLDLTRQTIVEFKHNGPIGLVPKMLGGVKGGFDQMLETVGVGAKVVTKKMKREPGVRALVEAFIVALRSESPSAPVSKENTLGVQAIIENALFGEDVNLDFLKGSE